MEKKIHEIIWTDEKVATFWNFQNDYSAYDDTWFTKQVGVGILNYVKSIIKLEGNILDYGAGKGFLIKDLLKIKKSKISALDFSEKAINNIQSAYSKESNFVAVNLVNENKTNFSGFPDNHFDFVFLIEAIEHLTDTYFEATFKEIHRILKNSGKLIITTPNNENLDLQKVLCPDCGCLFHRMQHIRSFTEKSIVNDMKKFSFETIHCSSTNFHFHIDNSIKTTLKKYLSVFRDKNYTTPHLIYIGQK